MNLVNLAWIIPLIMSFSGAIYGFGRLVQRVTDLKTAMDLIRDSVLTLSQQFTEVGARITHLEAAYSTGCKGRNDHG